MNVDLQLSKDEDNRTTSTFGLARFSLTSGAEEDPYHTKKREKKREKTIVVQTFRQH